MIDFSGEYRIECIADVAAVDAGLVDKPCWKISGPGDLEAFVWSWWRSEQKILSDFFRSLDIICYENEPRVFAVVARHEG